MHKAKPVPIAQMRPAHKALTLLFIVSVLNYTDRYMLAILLPAIKADLHLSDSQLGFLAGIAFSIFYVVMGIPIARLADQHSRKAILSVAVAAWSFMTAACGLAQTYFQLVVARILVGVGEAGASPASYSIISDYFPPKARTTAISVYLSGGCAGILIGFILGGWLTNYYSWRVALVSVGITGIAFAFLLARWLVEPARGQADGVIEAGRVPLREGIRALVATRTFRHAAMGCALYNALILAYVNWLPSLFLRSYEMGIKETGTVLAIVLGVSQFIGYMVGGRASDYLALRNVRWNVRFPAIVMVASTPMYVYAFTLDNAYMVLFVLCVPLMVGVMQVSSVFAITQSLVEVRMRAVASAVLILILNLVSGLGPFVVGLGSDALAAAGVAESLRVTMLLITVVVGVWASFHYLWAERFIDRDLREPTPAIG